MDPKWQCVFCLGRLEERQNIVGQDTCEDYKDIVECSKRLLKDQIERDFAFVTSLDKCPVFLCKECFEFSEKMYKTNQQLAELQEKLNSLMAEFVANINLRVSDNISILEDEVKVEDKNDLPIKDENSSTDDDEESSLDFVNESSPVFYSDNDSDSGGGNDEDPLALGSDNEEDVVGTDESQKPESQKLDDYKPLSDVNQTSNPRVVLSRIRFDQYGKLLNPDNNVTTKSALLGKRKAAIKASAKLKTIVASESANLSESSPTKMNTIVQPSPIILYANPINVITLPLVSEELTSLTCNICRCHFNSLEVLVSHKQTHIVNGIMSSDPVLENRTIGTALKISKYTCDICGKPQRHPKLRSQHRRSHLSAHERPYKCNVCGKGFIDRSHMREHAVVHSKDKPHKCGICGQSFKSLANCRNHKKLHKSSLSCRLCPKVFTTELSFIRHKAVHKPRKVFRCDECGKGFKDNPTLKNHLLTHILGNFRCDVCGKMCKNIIALKSHVLIHKNSNAHVCEICGMKTKTKFGLKEHTRIVHERILKHKCSTCGKEFGIRSNLLKHEDTHKTESERRKYDCNICDNIFKDPNLLLAHKADFHTAYTKGFIYCDKCQCKFTNGCEMVRHSKKHPGNCTKSNFIRSKCTYCTEIFPKRCDLLIHLANSHSAEKNPFQCETCHAVFRAKSLQQHVPKCKISGPDFEDPPPERRVRTYKSKPRNKQTIKALPTLRNCCTCGESFPSKKKLLKHQQTHPKEFICRLCNTEYNSQEELRAHKLENHIERDRFKCEFCEKSYTVVANLEIHRRIHTGEKPFVCQTCGKGFISKNYLQAHEMKHISPKAHICEICGKGYSQPGNLRTHLKTHEHPEDEKIFPCSTCGKCFALKANLLRHEKVHTGEKPYLCKTCGKSFGQSGTLRTHERLHTGERPFSCTICGKSFSDQSTWSKHKKTHNP